MLNRIVVNSYNLWVVIFVGLGTISTAYGLAIIGSTVGQPNFYTYFNLAPAGEPGISISSPFRALDSLRKPLTMIGCQAMTDRKSVV